MSSSKAVPDRILALDVLRGIAILGKVVSATMGGVSRCRSLVRALLTRARTLASSIPSTAAASA